MSLVALLILSQYLPMDIRQDGAKLGRARAINCSGAGITCSIDATTKIASFEVAGGGGGGLPVPCLDVVRMEFQDAGAGGARLYTYSELAGGAATVWPGSWCKVTPY